MVLPMYVPRRHSLSVCNVVFVVTDVTDSFWYTETCTMSDVLKESEILPDTKNQIYIYVR